MKSKTVWRALIGVTGFSIWSYMVYNGRVPLDPYMAVVTGAVITIIALVLNDTIPPKG